MTRIKICGITNVEDARLACDIGADALGCIAVPESPRFVAPDRVAAIREAAGPFVPVVVVVRTAADAVAYPADGIQFYEGPPPVGRWAVRAVRVRGEESVAEALAAADDVGAILLDTFHDAALGGVGKTFDWAVAARVVAGIKQPVILAGGLVPENVADAVARVGPYAVDVSSGVEAAPGRKEAEKIRRFVQAVRQADMAR